MEWGEGGGGGEANMQVWMLPGNAGDPGSPCRAMDCQSYYFSLRIQMIIS